MIMFLDSAPAEESIRAFRILLIASEIIIPIVVLIGCYYIFKPLMNPPKKKNLDENPRAKE